MDRRLLASIRGHEGLRLKAYQDTEGVWTIGYGRNLQELQIGAKLAEEWLQEDVAEAEKYARRFDEYYELDTEARRNVFVEMCFNLGPSRLGKFRKMLSAIRDHRWQDAAVEMLDSKWADQVGQRAVTLARLMEDGDYTE